MKMEIEIISQEHIKPSSPTPFHLKTHKISLLDQFATNIYFPVILFYPNKDTNQSSKKSLVLKPSLSQTLTQYYPLAGKVKDSLSIDCNDEGVMYVDAKANISLSQYLKQPDLASLYKMVPNMPLPYAPGPGSYVIMIQETKFSCGGTALGLYVGHMVMDGLAVGSFLKAWAAMANECGTKNPSFDGSSIFPQRDEFNSDAFWVNFVRVGKFNARRFVFDGSSLDSLKQKAISSGVENPTRVEVLSALFTKCLIKVHKDKYDNNHRPFAINHAVNFRRRMVPQFPERSLGNFVWLTHTKCNTEETQLGSLVCKLKEKFAAIDSDFVKNIQGDEGFVKFYDLFKELDAAFTREVDHVTFTSWCNFGLYDVDFGWGKPIWTTYAPSCGNLEAPFMNAVLFMDGRERRGIEAWVMLDEATMVMLEKDKELLQYASLNPSPLQ